MCSAIFRHPVTAIVSFGRRPAANVDVRNGGGGATAAAAASADTLIMLIAEPNVVVTPSLLHTDRSQAGEGGGGGGGRLGGKAERHGTRVQQLRADGEWWLLGATHASGGANY
uniref:Uncharacterized protein n=1 Tax=Anopheles atroparvus TaxID=41427 RepID=A0A182IK50_ANOAO